MEPVQQEHYLAGILLLLHVEVGYTQTQIPLILPVYLLIRF
jgi:hypothetical protein